MTADAPQALDRIVPGRSAQKPRINALTDGGNLMAATLQCQRKLSSLAARATGLGPIWTTVSGTRCRHWNSFTHRGLISGNSTPPATMPPKWHQYATSLFDEAPRFHSWMSTNRPTTQ